MTRQKGFKHTLETIAKIREGNKNKKLSDETKLKMSLAQKGRIMSEETKRKIRLAKWGKKRTHNFVMKLKINAKINPNYGMKGKHFSKMSIAKMSLAKKGKMTDEHKQKLKLLRRYRILPIKDTSIEIKIQAFLKELGIEYFTHQYMKIEHGYQCDILIPSLNLVIECDGNYWHKYPIGNDIDHIRTNELIEKGFKVLRLWEFEIRKMNIDEFKTKLETLV